MIADASTNDVDLNRLLLASAQGNVDAFKALYQQTSGRLLHVVRRNVWNACEADEVLQDVYLKVWRYASKFDPKKSLATTWITRIARNHSIDHLRRSSDRASNESQFPDRISEDQPWDAPDSGPKPDEVAENRQAALTMTASLQQLCRDQQLVLLMAFHQDLSQTEIAQQLDVPLGTVKSRMRRGLQALKTTRDFADISGASQHGSPELKRNGIALQPDFGIGNVTRPCLAEQSLASSMFDVLRNQICASKKIRRNDQFVAFASTDASY